MRIRKRFLSNRVIRSTVDSAKEVPSQGEENEVTSIPAPAVGTPRQEPEKVQDNWQSIIKESHRLLGCSSYNFKRRSYRPHVQEECSSNDPDSNGETVSDETQLIKERNKKIRLEQEKPRQKMVIQLGGGNAGKQICDVLSNSQMVGNCSGTAVLNAKQATVSSSFCKGDGKGMCLGNNPDSDGETFSDETQLIKERNKKIRLEQENPRQKMVIRLGGGNAGKKKFDLLSNSQMEGNCSGTAILNAKRATVSSSFRKGDGKGIFLGNRKDRKAETALKTGGSSGLKERAEALSMMEAAIALSSMEEIHRSARANSSCRLKFQGPVEDEEEQDSSDSAVKKRAKKIRTMTSIYDDIRSHTHFPLQSWMRSRKSMDS